MESWGWNEAKSSSHASAYAGSSSKMQNFKERKKEHIHSKGGKDTKMKDEWKSKDKIEILNVRVLKGWLLNLVKVQLVIQTCKNFHPESVTRIYCDYFYSFLFC